MKNSISAIRHINQDYRHLVGGYAIGLSELEINIGKVIEQAKELLSSKGKIVLAIPYQQAYESSFAYLLKLLAGRLLIEGNQRTFLLFPQTDLDLPRKLGANKQQTFILDSQFLLIHNLPPYQNLIDLLEAESNANQVIIATGIDEQWESFDSDIPVIFYSEKFNYRPGFDLEKIEEVFQEIIETDLQAFQNLSDWQKQAFLIVSAFDFLGVPLPFDLLLSSLDIDEEELTIFIENGNSTLLYCTEIDFPPTLLVTTKSPLIAEQLLPRIDLSDDKLLFEIYTNLINSVESANKDERYTILNLFQTASHWSSFEPSRIFLSRPNWRKLIDDRLEKLREVWTAGDNIEHLLWGKILEDMKRFELSAEVFDDGLKTNGSNQYLLQARARMFGKWALVEPGKMDQAEKLFRELTDETADNPYFLHAQGVFEAGRENPNEARYCFKDALSVASGDEGKAYILAALANLEIEMGNYATAEKRLGEISPESKSPYIPHIWAKLNFYRGNYAQAFEKMKELFAVRSSSIEGWNLIGEIAAKRGQWKKAKTAFDKVLSISPENVPTLRSSGDLETDLGRLAIDKHEYEKAEEHFIKAHTFLAKALEVEPRNYFVKVSRNVLWRYEIRLLQKLNQKEKAENIFNQAEKNLTQLLEIFKRSEFITHNLGELYLAQSLFDKAKHCFEKLGEKNKNLPNLLGLAKTELSLGNVEKAKQTLAEARQLLNLPNRKIQEKIRGLNSLAEIRLKLGDLAEAQNLAKTSSELDSGNSFTLRLYAKIKRRSGESDEADLLEKKVQVLADEELDDFLMEKK